MLIRTIYVSVLTIVGLFLSSCSENTLSSPTDKVPGDVESLSGALHNTAAVEVFSQATLRPNGTIAITLRVRCPSGFHVVEGPVTVAQGPFGREIFGEGFFTTRCNGFWQERRVRVVSPEGFRPGRATASASLDVENPETGAFLSASDNEVVRIRRAT
jgi:hypothetical protein